MIRFFNFFWKSIANCNTFLSFKVIRHAHSLKISITHNKKRIPLLNLLINYISARSAPKITFIKDESTFPSLNFLITGLCNSLANSLFEILSFLTPLQEIFFYQNI